MSNTTTTKRVTKRDNFNALLNISAVANDETLVKFIKNELELLDRKAASAKDGEKKMTPTQKQNETIKNTILSVMKPGEKVTVSEVMKRDPILDESNQKISALMRQLVLDGKVIREEAGRKTLFFLANEAEAES